MEEEVLYTTVVFKKNNGFPGDTLAIKDVNMDPSKSHDLITSENRLTFLVLIAAAVLGLLSLLLLSIIISLVLHSSGSDIELERQMENLRRERDALNWTLNVITDMEHFPVNEYCSKKVCKPCQAGWKLFGSSCYSFSFEWKSWTDSKFSCRNAQAQLVIIQTQEEQEFITSGTLNYSNNDRGYWIGGKKMGRRWTWEDGSKVTTTYWVNVSQSTSDCLLTLKRTDPLASWSSASCLRRQRWICEKPALIRAV